VGVAQILSRAQFGLDAPLVQIEAHLGSGLPGFSIVGLPAPVVRESRERVRSAILNAGFEFPAGRITVNLAPVELAKEGVATICRWRWPCWSPAGNCGCAPTCSRNVTESSAWVASCERCAVCCSPRRTPPGLDTT
jgi:hypothetical protein